VFAQLDVKVKFIQNPNQVLFADSSIVASTLKGGIGETYFYNKVIASSKDKDIPFSEDASRALHITGTVMYPMIQMAVYMGFKNIYLLGVDNTILPKDDISVQNPIMSHFYEEEPEKNVEYNTLRGFVSVETLAVGIDNDYLIAEEYCSSRGIKIFNATRGGILEAFERVDFDSLFYTRER